MEQKKTGAFLKALRMERGLTQEQLAEKFYVSGRTVSRWETGSNMPDLGTLVELADFYDLDIREIIDGERKSETMNEEMKDTMMKVAEYADAEKERLKTKMIYLSSCALILLVFASVLMSTDGFGVIPAQACDNFCSFAVGGATAMLALNIMFLTGVFEKLGKVKRRIRKDR